MLVLTPQPTLSERPCPLISVGNANDATYVALVLDSVRVGTGDRAMVSRLGSVPESPGEGTPEEGHGLSA